MGITSPTGDQALPRFGVPVAPIRLVAVGAYRNRMKARTTAAATGPHASESGLQGDHPVGLSSGVAQL